MIQTFVVIEHRKIDGGFRSDVIYAGINEQKAFSYTVDDDVNNLSLQAWVYDTLVSSHTRTRTRNIQNKWIKEFDKRETRKRKMDSLDKELIILKLEEALRKLKDETNDIDKS